MNRFPVRKVAVLGAGVMGAQIAAHLVNCRVPVVLFDLPAKDQDGAGSPSSKLSKSGIAQKAIENLKKIKPAPLGVADEAALIEPANYEEHLALLKDALDKAGVATQGEPVLARYNPPFTPWFMRRNEIWLALR